MFSCHVARLGYDNPKKIIKTFFKNLIANIFISKNVIPFIYFKIRSPLQAQKYPQREENGQEDI